MLPTAVDPARKQHYKLRRDRVPPPEGHITSDAGLQSNAAV